MISAAALTISPSPPDCSPLGVLRRTISADEIYVKRVPVLPPELFARTQRPLRGNGPAKWGGQWLLAVAIRHAVLAASALEGTSA